MTALQSGQRQIRPSRDAHTPLRFNKDITGGSIICDLFNFFRMLRLDQTPPHRLSDYGFRRNLGSGIVGSKAEAQRYERYRFALCDLQERE